MIYERSTGEFVHEVFSTTRERELTEIQKRLEKAQVNFKTSAHPVLLWDGRGTNYVIYARGKTLQETVEQIEKAKKIVDEFEREEEEKERLAREWSKQQQIEK